MKSFRTPGFSRFLLVAVMMLSWFLITNHCALAGLGAPEMAEEAVSCCHQPESAPAKAPCQELTECCRVVKASLAGNVEVKFDASKYQIEVSTLLAVLAATVAPPALPVIFDHGPPRVVSFAEAVLQRSLPSHAPPFAA